MKKTFLVLLLVAIISPLVFASGSSETSETTPTEVRAMKLIPTKEFTLDELATYNGKDGNRAYIAYDRTVYDVTDHPKWKTAIHAGQAAGADLTGILEKSPHGTSKLANLPIVGTLKKDM